MDESTRKAQKLRRKKVGSRRSEEVATGMCSIEIEMRRGCTSWCKFPPRIGSKGCSLDSYARGCGAQFLCHALCLREEQEIVGAAGFGVGAAHVESAEGMRTDHGARAFAIQVQIADVVLARRDIEGLA